MTSITRLQQEAQEEVLLTAQILTTFGAPAPETEGTDKQVHCQQFQQAVMLPQHNGQLL